MNSNDHYSNPIVYWDWSVIILSVFICFIIDPSYEIGDALVVVTHPCSSLKVISSQWTYNVMERLKYYHEVQ